MNTNKPEHIAVYLRHKHVPCWNFQDRHKKRLMALLPQTQVTVCENKEQFLETLPEADCAMVWVFQQLWLAEAPKLRILSTPAAGKDYFQLTTPHGLRLMYGQFHGTIIGETVVGMLLGMSRGILQAATTYASLPWPREELAAVQRPLRGSHVVIVGFGHIGTAIGAMLKPFGVRITGVKRNVDIPLPQWFTEEDRILSTDELDAVLPEADHVVLALPRLPETDDFFNAHRINLLNRHATLCNIGRGNALDEMSLCAALRAGRIAGACLDVFQTEPLPDDSFLRKCPRLWLMPHASAIAESYLDLYVDDFARQLQDPPTAD